MDWDKATAELSKPLDSKHVKPPAPGKYGDYIEGWHAIAEANRIFGFDGWSYAVTRMDMTNNDFKGDKHHVGYLCAVTVTVGDVTREDYGHGQGHGKSLGDAHDSAIKEAVTDALKRTLRTFGNPFGLALYDKTKANVADTATIEAQAKADAEKAAKTKALVDAVIAQMEDAEATAVVLQENQKPLAWVERNYPAEFKRVEDAAKAAGAPMRKVAA